MLSGEEFHQLVSYGEDDKVERKQEVRVSTVEQRAEFVRDMLALANSHGEREAYLLVGVDRSGNFHDIKHLDLRDENLQQSVGELVEPPIHFSYREIEIEGKTLGYIEIIANKRRPHVVRKKLKDELEAGETWIRHGSGKRRPTAWDYQEFCRAQIRLETRTPRVSVDFTPDTYENAIRSNWTRASQHEAKFMALPDLALLPFVTRLSLDFVIRNEGTAKAEDIRIRFTVPPGAAIVSGSMGKIHDFGRKGVFMEQPGSPSFHILVPELMNHLPYTTDEHNTQLLVWERRDMKFEYEMFESSKPEPERGELLLPLRATARLNEER